MVAKFGAFRQPRSNYGFPGSLQAVGGGGKMRDPGNEVAFKNE